MSPTGVPLPSGWTRIAQATSIFLPAFASGASMAHSCLLIPHILESPPPLMLRQWLGSYSSAKVFFPAVLEPTTVVFCLLAWQFCPRGGPLPMRSKLYMAAALLCQAIVPYTLLVVFPTNRKIVRKMDEMVEGETSSTTTGVDSERETAKCLVHHWGWLNLPRGIMMAVASILGLVATV